MKSSRLSSDRLLYLDVLRVLGTVAVVLIHVCSPLVVAFGNVTITAWWTGHILDSLSRWAVPIFVMLSGAVLLDSPTNENRQVSPATELKSLIPFFSKRFWRLAVPLFMWTLFFAWYYHVFRGDPLSITFSLRRIIFDEPYEHLYFLWLLLELAVITPWLKQLLKEISSSEHGSSEGASSESAFLAGLFLVIGIVWTPSRFLIPFFIPYIGYYLAGYVLKKLDLKNGWQVASVAMGTLLCFTAIVVGTWAAFSGMIHLSQPLRLYEYTTPFVMGMSLGVFVLVKKVCDLPRISNVLTKNAVILRVLSSVTFGIYLVHPVVIDVLNHGAGLSVLGGLPLLRVITVLGGTLLLSGLLSYGIELVTRLMRRFLVGTRYELKDPYTQFPYNHKR